jgi:hypothetical protein
VYTFGDAGFHGSLASFFSNQRIVGIARPPDGGGYWLVSSGFCAPLAGTTGPVSVTGTPAPPLAMLDSVVGMPGCLEPSTQTFRQQLEFIFDSPTPPVLSFDARYVATPTPGPSGMPVHVAGQAFLEVTLRNAAARVSPIFENLATAPNGRPESAPLHSPPYILAVQQTQDFEGVVRWVIGLDQVRPFFAGQISNPGTNTNNVLLELG